MKKLIKRTDESNTEQRLEEERTGKATRKEKKTTRKVTSTTNKEHQIAYYIRAWEHETWSAYSAKSPYAALFTWRSRAGQLPSTVPL